MSSYQYVYLPITMQATVLLEYPTTQLFLFSYLSMVSEMTMLLQRKTFMIGHEIQEHYIYLLKALSMKN